MKIKNIMLIITVLVAVLFLTSCLNYKSYYEEPENNGEDINLTDEIADIEKELGLEEETTEEITGAAVEDVKEETTVEDVLGELEETEEEADTTEEVTIPFDEEVDRSNLQKIEVDEGDLVSLNVNIDDPDQDNIEYTFSLPLNEQGKWKTNYGDMGEYVITITATDGELTTKKDLLLIVNKVNVAPLLKELKDKTIKEGESFKLEPDVIDPNGDSVTVAISEPLSSGLWETDHTSAGEYEITVTASDGELETKQTFLLTVLDVNVPPKITGLKDLVVNEGEKVELKPKVTDLDEDEVTVTISEPVGNSGVWQTTYTDHGVYTIEVVADDGKEKVTQSIKLTVKDVNMPPEIVEIKLG